MFSLGIDAEEVKRFGGQFTQASREAMNEAVSRGAASSRKLMQGFLSTGGEGVWKDVSPLTRELRHWVPKEAPALSGNKNLLAYEVKKINTMAMTYDEPTAVVGHSPFKARDAKKQPSMSRIIKNYTGVSFTMTPQLRREAILKALRLVKGDQKLTKSGKRSRSRATTTRGMNQSSKTRLTNIIRRIPKHGAIVIIPRREMPEEFLKRKHSEISLKMMYTYRTQLIKWLKITGEI